MFDKSGESLPYQLPQYTDELDKKFESFSGIVLD